MPTYVVVGSTGCGKSYLLNKLFGTEFPSSDDSSHVTERQREHVIGDDVFVDTVGLDHSESNFPDLSMFIGKKMVVIVLVPNHRVDVLLRRLEVYFRVPATKFNVFMAYTANPDLKFKSKIATVRQLPASVDEGRFVSFTFSSSRSSLQATQSTRESSAASTPVHPECRWWSRLICFKRSKVAKASLAVQVMKSVQLDLNVVKRYRQFGETAIKLLVHYRALNELRLDSGTVGILLTNKHMCSFLDTIFVKKELLDLCYGEEQLLNDETYADILEAIIGKLMDGSNKEKGLAMRIVSLYIDTVLEGN